MVPHDKAQKQICQSKRRSREEDEIIQFQHKFFFSAERRRKTQFMLAITCEGGRKSEWEPKALLFRLVFFSLFLFFFESFDSLNYIFVFNVFSW